MVKCINCGNEIYLKKYKPESKIKRKFCSHLCREKHLQKLRELKCGKKYDYDRKCLFCQKQLIPKKVRLDAKYCDNLCRKKYINMIYFEKNKNRIINPNLATGTIGTIAELRVSIDLLNRGFEVFRALSPSCSCDLAILKNNKLIRVEVKSSSYTTTLNGFNYYIKKDKFTKADMFAFVLPDGIKYNPELETIKKENDKDE